MHSDSPILTLPFPAGRRASHGRTRWRIALAMLLCLGLITAAHAAFGGREKRYSVSVPIAIKPYDPNQWALFNAGSYEAARAYDPTLPDPYAADLMLPLPDGAGAADLTPDGAVAVAPMPDMAAVRANAYVGPTARPYVFRGASSSDAGRALYCLTLALYYEAISETDDGMRGVAQVILNRVRHPSFPNTVCGVVFQGSDRITGCQFTFTCDGAMARAPGAAGWARSRRIAAEALSGKVFEPVGLATHYHTQAIWPRWGKSLVMTNVIGAHIFHRWRGRWGEPAAFRAPYAGREPAPGPYRSVAAQIAERRGAAAIRSPGYGGYASGPAGGAGIAGGPAVLDAKTAAAMAAARAQEDARAGRAPADNPAGVPARGGFGQGADYTAGAPRTAPRTSPPAAKSPAYLDRALNQSGQIRDEYQSSGEWIGQPR